MDLGKYNIWNYTTFDTDLCLYLHDNIFDVAFCVYLHAWFLLFYDTKTVKESDSDTIVMVIMLVAGVGGVFFLFALMALCYR